MLRNYMIVALRHLRKNKIFSLINVLGLAVVLTALIALLSVSSRVVNATLANPVRSLGNE